MATEMNPILGRPLTAAEREHGLLFLSDEVQPLITEKFGRWLGHKLFVLSARRLPARRKTSRRPRRGRQAFEKPSVRIARRQRLLEERARLAAWLAGSLFPSPAEAGEEPLV